MVYSGQMRFQEMSSVIGKEIVQLYDHAVCGCILVGSIVAGLTFLLVFSRYMSLYVWEGYLLEVVWTLVPIFILVMLALPSLQLLYMMNELIDPKVTFKVIGHQWYWSYESGLSFVRKEFTELTYDSYAVPDSELKVGDFRNLDVDHRAVLPYGVSIRVLLSSADVIHSWAVPSLGLKLDAVPGRLNQLPLIIERPGVFYGQCSELCGANHAFMPVVVEAVSSSMYIDFIEGLGVSKNYIKDSFPSR